MSTLEVDKIIPQSGTATQLGESGDTITIPAGATITNNGTATGFGSADTEKVKVSSNDTTAGFLNGKLVAGTNISLTEGSDGGNETLTAALSGTISTSQIGANQVTGAKLNTDVISAQTELAAEPADTDEFLVSDAGTLKRIDYSLIKGGGITEADMWRINAEFTGSVQPITANWERCDEDTFAKIGTGMSLSSGIWSFPVTGLYQVIWHVTWKLSASTSRYVYSELITTNDNSTYTERGVGWSSIWNSSSMTYTSATVHANVNVSNVSNQKVKLGVNVDNSSVATRGLSTGNHTYVSFIRLGDSQ